MIQELEKVEKTTGKKTKKVLMWLHGLGADASDFFILSEILKLPPTLFVFPNAPIIEVTINQKMPMRAWYDITGENIFQSTNQKQLAQSVLQVENLIASYIAKGYAPCEIILGGFSQGAVVSLAVAYRNRHAIGKVVAFAGYLLAKINTQIPPKKPKILLTHGINDQVIPIKYGQQARDFFLEQDFTTYWKQYPIEHTVCPEQIAELEKFAINL